MVGGTVVTVGICVMAVRAYSSAVCCQAYIMPLQQNGSTPEIVVYVEKTSLVCQEILLDHMRNVRYNPWELPFDGIFILNI